MVRLPLLWSLLIELLHLGWLSHYFAILPDNDWQFEGAVPGLDVFGGAAQGSLGADDEGRRFRCFGGSVLFHGSINWRRDPISWLAELATRFAGSPRLSQIAHRVANGR